MIYLNLPSQIRGARRFLFEEWEKHSPEDYSAFVAALEKGGVAALSELPQRIVAYGSDRDERWVRAARYNFSNITHWVQELQALQHSPPLERSQEEDQDQQQEAASQPPPLFESENYCTLLRGDFEQVEQKIPQGAIIVTNLPYGKRSTPNAQALRETFERFGNVLKKRQDFREVYVINGSTLLQPATKLEWIELCRFRFVFLPHISDSIANLMFKQKIRNRGLPASLLKLKRKDEDKK